MFLSFIDCCTGLGPFLFYLGLLDSSQLHLASSSVKVTTYIFTYSFWSWPFYLLLLFCTLCSSSYAACPTYYFSRVLSLLFILIRILFPFLTVAVFMASSSFSFSLLTSQLLIQVSSGLFTFHLLYRWQRFSGSDLSGWPPAWELETCFLGFVSLMGKFSCFA